VLEAPGREAPVFGDQRMTYELMQRSPTRRTPGATLVPRREWVCVFRARRFDSGNFLV
jgi:hypothetical protein